MLDEPRSRAALLPLPSHTRASPPAAPCRRIHRAGHWLQHCISPLADPPHVQVGAPGRPPPRPALAAPCLAASPPAFHDLTVQQPRVAVGNGPVSGRLYNGEAFAAPRAGAIPLPVSRPPVASQPVTPPHRHRRRTQGGLRRPPAWVDGTRTTMTLISWQRCMRRRSTRSWMHATASHRRDPLEMQASPVGQGFAVDT